MMSFRPLKTINGEPNLSQTSNNSLKSDESNKASLVGLKQTNLATKTVTFQGAPKADIVVEIVETQQEVPKKVETKELVTPALNPGIRTVPSYEQQKDAEETAKPFEKKQLFSIESVRRNHQNSLANKQQIAQTLKEPRIFISDLKIRKLPIDKVRIKIVCEAEYPKTYYVIESLPAVDLYLSHLENCISDIVENAKIKSYKPLKNEIVLAQFEGVYYRAVIENIINDDPSKPTYGVFFIDYGNVSQVHEDDLLPCSANAKGEVILHVVLLENLPSTLTKNLQEKLNSPDGFDIVVVKQTNKHYVANIDGI